MEKLNQYSSLKIFHHKDRLDSLYNDNRKAPIYMRIKPTNQCNHHCNYCMYGSGKIDNKAENRDLVQKKDMIPWPKMQELIHNIGKMGVKAVTFSGGGEPLTYPKMEDAVSLLNQYSIDLSLITNGQLLKNHIAELFYHTKWVRVSFDSPNEEEYARLRNISRKDFNEVCHNIQSFANQKDSGCILGINFVISKNNYHRVYEAAKFLKELGVNNIKFAAVVMNELNYHKDIKDSVIEQIHRAEKELTTDRFSIINNYENDYADKNFTVQPFKQCYISKLVTVIAADCKVYYCHARAYDSKAILGDITNQTFEEIWFSKDTTEKLNKLKPPKDCKNFCAYETRNQLIEAYFDVDKDHINFI